ncbi:MAG: DUF4388 domain-containing protein [Thermoanaerobaculales bacterium]|jgi:hypothetical protein|nr:DUF4388 domain-containing protein [Thermoanaerobaculales bacterium]
MIRGNLDRLHLGDLLHWLELGGQTGRLTLTDRVGERRLDLLHGRIVYVSSTVPEERLASWLARDGLLPATSVRRLLAASMLRHELFTDVLLAERAISETALGASLTVLAELMMSRILDAAELRFELDPNHPIRDPSGLYLSLTPSRLLLDSARRVDESKYPRSTSPSPVLPLDEEAVEDFFWQLVRQGIPGDDPVDGDQLSALHDIVRNVMASLAQWLASSTGLVPQPADQGEIMAAALDTTGRVRLFGLPQTAWNLMVLACSIRADELTPPGALAEIDDFAAALDLWPEVTAGRRWERGRAGALDRLTRRAAIVWSRGAAAAAAELEADPGAAELAAHLLTVPTDLVLWVLAALPVPHNGIRRALLAELPRRIGAGLSHLADFPPEIRQVLHGARPTLLGACLHVSRGLVPSAAVWPMTMPDDEAMLSLAAPDRLQRAAAAARQAVEGLGPTAPPVG